MKLIHLTTVGITLRFLAGQIRHLTGAGHSVIAVSNPDPDLFRLGEQLSIPVQGVRLQRRISPAEDIASLLDLVRLFRNERPDVVQAHSPKAGLLGCLAARLARVPLVIFHLHGLPYLEGRGWRNHLLKICTRITCRMAHEIWCVSPTIREAAIADGHAVADRFLLHGNGSICGVEAADTFVPPAESSERPFTILFAGRLTPDKGLHEILAAWAAIRRQAPQTMLQIAGAVDERDGCPEELLAELASVGNVAFLGWQEDMPRIYAAADLLWLPSHREGFGMVLLEAAAMQVPAVASDIPGCRDAVCDGQTGTLIPVRDAEALTRATLRYMQSPELRQLHGSNGRQRVLRDFNPQRLYQCFESSYHQSLQWRTLRRSVNSKVKRWVDVALAVWVLLLASPVLILIAIAIRLDMGSPVLFRQVRPGLDDQPFEMLKFRTMRDAIDRHGQPLPDGERLTSLGSFLRRTSLDELPELWNVLRGEMSLVGPRPLLLRYTPFFTDSERRRFSARPGITGWAQIHGRNYLGWDARLAKDVWYVENWSLGLDLKILFKTALEVFRQSGIAVDANTVMQDLNVERTNQKGATRA